MKQVKKSMRLIIFSILLVVLSACGGASSEAEQHDPTFVISSGGGYNIIGLLSSSADNDSGSDMVGVRDDNGNWIHPLSVNHSLIDDNGQIKRTRNTVVAPSPTLTQSQLESAREHTRRNDIRASYRHYDVAVFELVLEAYTGGGQRVNIVELRYDARNNVLVN